jgi:hypothetical protein
MAICKTCGKKYSKWTTPVSARGVCGECFEAELSAEREVAPPEDVSAAPMAQETVQHQMNPPPIPNINSDSVEKVRIGQRWILFAILLNIALVGLAFIPKNDALIAVFGVLSIVLIIASLILSLLGVLRLSAGLGYRLPARILIVILMFVPLVSLLVLLMLNSKATAVLRAAGYKVGVLGAAPKVA